MKAELSVNSDKTASPATGHPASAPAASPALVVEGVTPVTYSIVLFAADIVARSPQTHSGMLVARALPAPKMHGRLRHRIYASDHLGLRCVSLTHYPAEVTPESCPIVPNQT